MKRNPHFYLFFFLLALGGAALSCNLPGSGETMTVLAGSELKDIEPLLDEIREETGVRLEFEYIGTLNGAEALLGGAEYDLAWFSHARYLGLLEEGSGLIVTQEKTMLSPVVMGVKESKAREFGWLDNDVTWQDIAGRAGAGELRYAMTNPAASNSGFTALVGVAAALSHSSDALEAGDVNTEAMQTFFEGQALTSGSSGWLAESYVEAQDELDAIINYESVLLGLNESGQLREELVLIYPQEGIITADYPLMLLNPDRREEYDRLVDYLRSPGFQETLMESTLRRPVIPGVALDPRIPDPLLVELPFPGRAEVIDSLIFAYLDEQRVPAHAFFVLDTSGSMEGEGLADLKMALNNLTGLDTSLTGRFARFREREKVSLIRFNHGVAGPQTFTIANVNPQGEEMGAIRELVNGLHADGDTAIYDALRAAYTQAAAAQEADPDRYYTVVLMSDGENTAGSDLQAFEAFYRSLPPDARQIRTFPVIFGNADEEAMERIAELTGGRAFDGRDSSLSFIFKQIRGYQ